MWVRPRLAWFTACAALVVSFSVSLSTAAEVPLTYGQTRDFLLKYDNGLIELTNDVGGRILICPKFQGRVMTSTVDGLDGRSLGWINREFIEKGEANPHFNNYGGEDRFWLGPEGGQFSLFFAPGAKPNLENWLTPKALNDGAFQLAEDKNSPFYRLTRRMQFQNASRAQFDLDVVRDLRVLAAYHFGKLFGQEAQALLEASKLKMIGFESVNSITNRGAAMTQARGLVSIWSLSQFPGSPNTWVIAPFKAGAESDLGPIVKSDYFGKLSPDRLKIGASAVYFKGDGNYRSKIGVSQKRAKPIAGSLDYDHGLLTLVHYSLPEDPSAMAYVNNSWDLPQKQPFVGDVFNSYNDGPAEAGRPGLGVFYELESLSPAAQLAPGKSQTHVHSTFHIQGDPAVLAKLAKAALGVEPPGK